MYHYKKMAIQPTFVIIAGVNGSGKTTFALDYYKNHSIKFINADSLATALSPNNPDLSQFKAGKLMRQEIDQCIKNKQSFAIETTLSSKNYLKIINQLKQDNWKVEMLYLYLPSVDLSIDRVAERVKNGGHCININDIKRRYSRSMTNLMNQYLEIVDNVSCLKNSNGSEIIFQKNHNKLVIYNNTVYQKILEYKQC